MNKEQYLKRLRSLLRVLPEEERATILDFYREIIEDKIEAGATETQAVAELGGVYTLAQKILAENPNRRPKNIGKIVGIALASLLGAILVAGIVAASLNLVLSGDQKAAPSVQGEEKTSVHTPAAGKVEKVHIDAKNKDVSVERGEGENITFTYWRNETENYTESLIDGELKLVNRALRGSLLPPFSFLVRGGHKQIRVTVPEDFAGEIEVITGNGDITAGNLENLSGISCRTGNADIRLDGVHSKTVTAQTSNAEIHLLRVRADIVGADTSNGNVVLKELDSPDVTLETSNANITGSILGPEKDYSIRTSTSNANIELTFSE